VVITGGPCSGKTTLVNYLVDQAHGQALQEAALLEIQAQIAAPAYDTTTSQIHPDLTIRGRARRNSF
jgi:hypothetical protein